MDAYCITLDRTNPTRALATMREIERLGFKGQFVDGVNIKGQPLSKFKDLVSTRAYRELLEGRQVHEALSGLGSLGCYLAHLNLWKLCASSDRPIAIFEDDAQFDRDAPQRLQSLLKEAEKYKFDILRLIYVPWSETVQVSPLLRRINLGQSASAYILQPKAARVLVEHALPAELQLDLYMDFCGLKYGLNQYYPNRPFHRPQTLPSTIGHSQVKQCQPLSCWVWMLWVIIIVSMAFFGAAFYVNTNPAA